MYVRFEMPKELVDRTYQFVELAKESGKVREGTNEVPKLVERGEAKTSNGHSHAQLRRRRPTHFTEPCTGFREVVLMLPSSSPFGSARAAWSKVRSASGNTCPGRGGSPELLKVECSTGGRLRPGQRPRTTRSKENLGVRPRSSRRYHANVSRSPSRGSDGSNPKNLRALEMSTAKSVSTSRATPK